MLAATLDVDESLDAADRPGRAVRSPTGAWSTWSTPTAACSGSRHGTRPRQARRCCAASRSCRPAVRTPRSPVEQVLRTGQPVLLPQVDDDVLTEPARATTSSPTSTASWRRAARSSCRCAPAAQVLGVLAWCRQQRAGRTTTTTWPWRPTSPAAPRSPSTTRGCTSASTTSPSSCSAACSPQLPVVAGLDRAARYLPGSRAARSAATGTTCSGCPTARSASPSATSWATT